jgi:glycosyltransferase involved in cell wall biosynthesis
MSNVIVLPIFVDIKKIQSAKIKADLHKKYPDYDFIILMASRLSKEKNIGMAIEAMKELSLKSKVKSKMLLLIVGDGPEKEKLIVKCRMLNVVDNVKFEPWTDDLVSYYKTSDLFLLISNYEGYGRTAIEAMAAGLPVVMTDVGLAGEILVDDLDGRIVPVGDAKALIEAILQLLENPLKREEFKQNSLKLLEKWQTKKEYLDKYKNSLGFNKMLK